MEYTLDEKVLGDVPPVSADEIYRGYGKMRKEFVDAETYMHEVELHQAAMKRIAEFEKQVSAIRYALQRAGLVLDDEEPLTGMSIDRLARERDEATVRAEQAEADARASFTESRNLERSV